MKIKYLLILLFITFFSCNSNKLSDSEIAYNISMEEVKEKMNFPLTARFPSYETDSVEVVTEWELLFQENPQDSIDKWVAEVDDEWDIETSKNSYRVRSFVTASNAMGVPIENTFEAWIDFADTSNGVRDTVLFDLIFDYVGHYAFIESKRYAYNYFDSLFGLSVGYVSEDDATIEKDGKGKYLVKYEIELDAGGYYNDKIDETLLFEVDHKNGDYSVNLYESLLSYDLEETATKLKAYSAAYTHLDSLIENVTNDKFTYIKSEFNKFRVKEQKENLYEVAIYISYSSLNTYKVEGEYSYLVSYVGGKFIPKPSSAAISKIDLLEKLAQ